MGFKWPDKRDKTKFAAWPGVEGVEIFSSGHLPQFNSVGAGADWVMGLFS